MSVHFDLPLDLWEFPLETVSLSEEGFERTYQGTVLFGAFADYAGAGASPGSDPCAWGFKRNEHA